MRILAVNKFFYLKGGSETSYFSLNRLLRENGHEVAEFSMKDEKNLQSPYESYFVENVDYSSQSVIKKVNNAIKLVYSFEAKRKAGELIKATKPDIAHLHIFQHQITPSIISEFVKNGIPVVHTVHDMKVICPNYIMLSKGSICEKCKGGKFIHCLTQKCVKDSLINSFIMSAEAYFHKIHGSYKNVRAFICPSKFYVKMFTSAGISPKKLFYVPNFIDCKTFDPLYEANGKYFIYFGRLSKEKGIQTLLKAMRNVSGAALYIVGMGPCLDEIESFIKENKLDNKVKLFGYRTGSELRDLIRNALFSVFPSVCYENGPYSVMEAMAYGKPVIGSNIGGIPELIDNNKTGLLFEMGNDADLADKINFLLNNRKTVVSMGKEGRMKIEHEFNKELHLCKILEVYKSL